MLQKYKKTIIITSIVTLCPILLGLFWWNRLPDEIATHFGEGGAADGWSSKPAAVFGLPLILLALHFVCVFVTAYDPKRKNISGKMYRVILWLVPVISLVTNVSILANAAGYPLNIEAIVNVMVGIVFLLIGNYLPKCRLNYSAGIRTPWTLSSEENWNRTHRLGGWMMALAGILFLINAYVQWTGMFAVALILVFIPGVYSFLLYKKGI